MYVILYVWQRTFIARSALPSRRAGNGGVCANQDNDIMHVEYLDNVYSNDYNYYPYDEAGDELLEYQDGVEEQGTSEANLITTLHRSSHENRLVGNCYYHNHTNIIRLNSF